VLGRLFDKLFECGVVVVATSNWAMDDLFQGGVNRHRFLPFIKKLQQYLDPLDMAEGTDYRQNHAANWPLYVVAQAGESAEAQLLSLFNQYAHGTTIQVEADMPTPKKLNGRAVWYTFKSICETALGRAQYLALLRGVDTLIIENVPTLGAADADATLRLTTLIDIAYENHRRVIISAAAYPHNLCTAGPAAAAFKRTASRLAHMQARAQLQD
jgi:cell division protein ZapE